MMGSGGSRTSCAGTALSVPLYDVLWVSHAERQYNSLSLSVRRAVMDKVALLQRDPASSGVYDPKSDTFTTDFAFGIIMYAVVDAELKIIMLRVSAID